jgi:NADH-quinone oxidoreductase subunit J
MIVRDIFFFLSAVLILSAMKVVSSRNPVHSVLFLILAFFNAAGLFLLQGAEFLAMALVIVYVGAVAVLFLFVVMMLDVDFASMRSGFQRYMPGGVAVGFILMAEICVVFGGWHIRALRPTVLLSTPTPQLQNTVALGQVIYTQYLPIFQLSGIILLVAMIGAIVLTLRDRNRGRRQNIDAQVNRRVEDTLVVVPVPLRAGMGQIGIFRAKERAGDINPNFIAGPNSGVGE